MKNLKIAALLIACLLFSTGTTIQNSPFAPNYTIFTQTANVTVANSTVETSVVSTGIGSATLGADYLSAGKSININVAGFHSATSNPTIRWRIKLGGTTILDTTAVNSGASTNQLFMINAIITCRTDGAMGTVIGQGVYQEVGNTNATAGSTSMPNVATTTVNTTGTLAVDVTVQWGTMSVNDTSTTTNLIIK